MGARQAGAPHLRRWEAIGDFAIQRALEQLVFQDLIEVLGHDSLLFNTAVVLNGQDDRVLRCLAAQHIGQGRESEAERVYVCKYVSVDVDKGKRVCVLKRKTERETEKNRQRVGVCLCVYM